MKHVPGAGHKTGPSGVCRAEHVTEDNDTNGPFAVAIPPQGR